jgi:hypothetical protein
VPIQFERNVFRREVLGCETVGGLELGHRLVDAARAPQRVAVHMVGVRDGGRHAGVHGGVRQRLIHTAGVLERVRQIMPRGEVRRRQRQCPLVERLGAGRAPLSAVRRVGRFGDATLQPELFVGRLPGERFVQRLAVRDEPDGVVRRVLGRHLRRAKVDVAPVVLRDGARDARARSNAARAAARRVELTT